MDNLPTNKVRDEVWNKIREITGGSSEFVDSHTSDDQFIELVEHFLPKIDGSEYGQEIADWVFVSRSFDSVEDDEILDSIKANLGSLEVPNSKDDVEKIKKTIEKDISDYKKRKGQ